jgi:hypothetical protein
LQICLDLQDLFLLQYRFHSRPFPLDTAWRSNTWGKRIYDLGECIDRLLAFLQSLVGDIIRPMEFISLLHPCEKDIEEAQVFEDGLDLLRSFADGL